VNPGYWQGIRSVLRDLRAGELRVLIGAVTIAVAAMTAVGFFTDRVSQAVAIRSAEVLAADLVLRSNRPIEDTFLRRAEALGLATAKAVSFPSVVVAENATSLADIEAVGDGYPLRGRLRTSETPFGETRTESGIPEPGEAWADAKLLARLGAEPGAVLGVGAARVKVTRVLDYRPDQGWSFVDLAPTLLLNERDVEATGLIQPGSRVTYRQLFAGDAPAVARLRSYMEPRLGVSERIRDLSDAGPEIRAALDRAQRFLGLAALTGTLLAAVAVAMAAGRYARRQIDPVALMKAFGARQSFLLRAALSQVAAITFIGGLGGVALGYLSQAGLALLLSDLAGGNLPAPGPRPVVGGLVLAGVVLTGFALPSLVAIRRVPPLRVLRRDLSPPPPSAWLIYGTAVAAVLGLLFWQVRDVRLTAWLAFGVGLLALVLAAASMALIWFAGRVRGSAGASWRYALAGLARRRRDSVVQVVAFGLGIMVLLLLTVVRNDLLLEWRATLPENAANRFLINIQPDEVAQVWDFLDAKGIDVVLMPLVRARLVSINGTSIGNLDFESERGRRLADREANLSWSATLQEDNRLVEGDWWDETTSAGQVSVEQDFAVDVGIALGDRLTFDVAGETFSATVTSLRTVQWDSFRPNFFMLFPPGSLDIYPRTHIGSLYASPQDGAKLLELIRAFPSVTVIDIDAILGQVRRVMDQAAMAVQYVFLFSLAAGVLVLLAVVESGRDERLFESALLRALGGRRRQVLAGAVIEFSVLGALAGLLAAGGAQACGALLSDQVFRLEYSANPWLWLIGSVAGLLLVGGSGFLATRSVVSQPPDLVLRRF
jgi:putative ABC transport system permease protein